MYTSTEEEDFPVFTQKQSSTNKRMKINNKSSSPTTMRSRRALKVPADLGLAGCSANSTPWTPTSTENTDGFIKPKKTLRLPKKAEPFQIPTKNSMAPLDDMPDVSSNRLTTTHTTNINIKKPPPIYIDITPSEPNSSSMVKLFKQLNVSAAFRRYNEKQYIVYPTDELATRALQTHFTTQKIPFYTHAPRSIKKHKQYLILGLDINQPSIQEIHEALSQVPDIINLRHMNKTDSEGKKQPIHPVVVTTLHTTTLEHFKNINSICYYRVRIVKYNPAQNIAQCTNCQQFGHSRNYCKRPPICVRCSGLHDISECDKTHSTIKCAGCGGDHVSSFRQCPTRLQLIAKKETRLLSRRNIPHNPKTALPPLLSSFPPLLQHNKPIPGFTQSIPSSTPPSEPFSTSGFAELLSHFFQQFTSMLIHHIENTFKNMCATLLQNKK